MNHYESSDAIGLRRPVRARRRVWAAIGAPAVLVVVAVISLLDVVRGADTSAGAEPLRSASTSTSSPAPARLTRAEFEQLAAASLGPDEEIVPYTGTDLGPHCGDRFAAGAVNIRPIGNPDGEVTVNARALVENGAWRYATHDDICNGQLPDAAPRHFWAWEVN